MEKISIPIRIVASTEYPGQLTILTNYEHRPGIEINVWNALTMKDKKMIKKIVRERPSEKYRFYESRMNVAIKKNDVNEILIAAYEQVNRAALEKINEIKSLLDRLQHQRG